MFGTNSDRFYETLSHTAIRGCVTNAAAFAFQIANYKILLSIRVGQYLGVAVLIKGKFCAITDTIISRTFFSGLAYI